MHAFRDDMYWVFGWQKLRYVGLEHSRHPGGHYNAEDMGEEEVVRLSCWSVGKIIVTTIRIFKIIHDFCFESFFYK